MKKLFLSLGAVIFCALSILAQTPYDNFAPEQGVKSMIELPEMQFKVTNTDPNSEIRYVEFDKNTQSVKLLNDEGDILKTIVLNPDDKKFTTVDPLSEKYYSWSPYVYCYNNPMKFVDPTGEAPIFDPEGNLIGTDADGWKGTAIVMNKDSYKEGMSNKDALKAGTKLNEYGESIRISDDSWTTVTDNGGSRMNPYIQNNSESTIFYKPEGDTGKYKDGGAYSVAAGKDIYMPIDGVKTGNMKPNEVFKVPNGGQVIINNDLDISYTNPVYKLANIVPDYRDSSHTMGGLMKSPASNFNNLARSFMIDSRINIPNTPGTKHINRIRVF